MVKNIPKVSEQNDGLLITLRCAALVPQAIKGTSVEDHLPMGSFAPSHRGKDFNNLNPYAKLEEVVCSLCSETMERELLALHKGENCPQRIVTCEYCEFPLPAVDLFKHQEVCGNRTEYCHLCSRYIRLRERNDHESRVHGRSDNAAETSRGRESTVPERRDQGPDRRQPTNGVSQKRLLFTIAITGVAVLLGSMFLQRKANTNEMQ